MRKPKEQQCGLCGVDLTDDNRQMYSHEIKNGEEYGKHGSSFLKMSVKKRSAICHECYQKELAGLIKCFFGPYTGYSMAREILLEFLKEKVEQ